MERIAVVDGKGLRKLTIREGLDLFGFPENYQINLPINKAFDLLGNTVVIPVIREITKRIVIDKIMSASEQNFKFFFSCSAGILPANETLALRLSKHFAINGN